MNKLRVVQWTTGRTGSAAVRAIVEHPYLDLVGCFAYSPEKVGVDVGALAGLDPIGVLATDDVEALLMLQPDCIVYCAFRPNFEHLERILASGCNVVTTVYMLAGSGYGEEARARLAEAMERGGSSLYAGGIYPGHAGMVALAASATCLRIDQLSLLESVDMSAYANEQMFRAMGVDRTLDDPEVPEIIEGSCGSFKEQTRVIAHALDVTLDDIRFDVEFGAAVETTDLGFMTVEEGRIAGFRGVISGMHEGRPVIQCRFVWTLGMQTTPNWSVEHGYLVEIVGEPNLQLRLAPIDGAFDGATTTALPVVNAIEQVVNAAPGVVNHGQLPLVVGRHRVKSR